MAPKRQLPRITYENFEFSLDSRYIDKEEKRYVCRNYHSRNNKCSVILWQRKRGKIEVYGQHEHLSNLGQHSLVINKVIDQHLTSNESSKSICQTVMQKAPNVDTLMTPGQLRSRINGRRYRRRPKITDNIEQLDEAFQTYYGLREYFQEKIVATDQSMAWIFGSNKLMNSAANIDELHIDTTNLSVPELFVTCTQLLTINIRRQNKVFPVIHALCTNRTKELHSEIFIWMLDKIPSIREDLKIIIVDLDESIIASIKEIYSWVKIRFSWMQFIRYITRKWRSFALPQDQVFYEKLLQMIYTLPIVSTENAKILMFMINSEITRVEDGIDNLAEFNQFLRNFIHSIAHSIQLWTMPYTILNLAEEYNELLLNKFQNKNPDFFKFCSKFRTIIKNFEEKWKEMDDREKEEKTRSSRRSDFEICLGDRKRLLDGKKIDIIEFMSSIYNHIGVQQIINKTLARKLYTNDSSETCHDDGLDLSDNAIPLLENGEVLEERSMEVESLPDTEVLEDGSNDSWVYKATRGVDFNDSEISEDDQDTVMICLTCLRNKPKVKFNPCGHQCICFSCSFMMDLKDRVRRQRRDNRGIKCTQCNQKADNMS